MCSRWHLFWMHACAPGRIFHQYAALRPSGYLLADLEPVSILVTYPKGSIWACMPDCRIHDLSPRTPVPGPPGFKKGATLGGYGYMFLLGSITASPPAIMSGTHD
ncbi:hypothetical protein ACFWZ3_15150 [Frateuria sp. GZRR35]|uniref:hypothetical protein n=1 Tax=Frateuria sp. GZRR35 TaxID=3351536 RepID=UPI003EDBD9E5